MAGIWKLPKFVAYLLKDSFLIQLIPILQGQATDIAIQAQEILKLKTTINTIYAKHTQKDVKEIGEWINPKSRATLWEGMIGLREQCSSVKFSSVSTRIA